MKLDIPNRLIVIAQSARMLAQMAVDSGFEVIAIDCFADLDTRNLAVLSFKVESLALDDLQPVLEKLQEDYGLMPIVYGSGFEHFVDLLLQDPFFSFRTSAIGGRIEDNGLVYIAATGFALDKFHRIVHNPADAI